MKAFLITTSIQVGCALVYLVIGFIVAATIFGFLFREDIDNESDAKIFIFVMFWPIWLVIFAFIHFIVICRKLYKQANINLWNMWKI